ncbi:MAG TPA: hypothetical protein VGN61_15675 [Verrucomicrobiae bacterium]
MKGNALLAILLTFGLSLQAQPRIVGPGVVVQGGIMQGVVQGNVFGNSLIITPNQPVSAPQEPEIQPKGDVVEFVDGSLLHGQLEQMDLAHGLAWENPDSKSPIHFQPNHIDYIRFARSDSMSLKPTCHLRFANGDDLFGAISSLDSDHLGFSTWFGGTMTIPRSAIRGITFLSKNYTILYEGPYDSSGWIRNSPQSWNYHEGWFISQGPGTLARDFSLTNSSTVDFDVAWAGTLDLQVQLYTDVLDRMEYNNGSYVLQFTAGQTGQILLRQSRSIGPLRNFGVAPMPDLGGKTKIHVTIQCNKDESSISVFVNNQLVRVWKDDSGFAVAGSGILFQTEVFSGGTSRIGNLKVSEWQGSYEPDTTLFTTNTDSIHFINHDRAGGKILGIKDGSVALALGDMTLNIPMQRITQINFATTNTSSETPGPWVVRAHFPGGGSISFQLEKWDNQTITGQSPLFGPLAFQSRAIREMEFNLDRPKNEEVATTTREFEDLDE